MATTATSRNPSASTFRRANVRRLLDLWMNLHTQQRELLGELAEVEGELSEHFDLNKEVQYGRVSGPFTEVLLDPNETPENRDTWLAFAIDAACA